MSPFVSVIVAVYNVEKYLRPCLESLVNQTLTDIEIIVVNDASTDGSLELIEEYRSRHAALRVVWAGITDPNYSLSWKANDASVAASGELGYTAGTFVEKTKGADGKTTTATGKFLCVWKKQKDGKWKGIRDMWNYDAK